MGEVVPVSTSPTLHPPIPSHCAWIAATSTLRVKTWKLMGNYFILYLSMTKIYFLSCIFWANSHYNCDVMMCIFALLIMKAIIALIVSWLALSYQCLLPNELMDWHNQTFNNVFPCRHIEHIYLVLIMQPATITAFADLILYLILFCRCHCFIVSWLAQTHHYLLPNGYT